MNLFLRCLESDVLLRVSWISVLFLFGSVLILTVCVIFLKIFRISWNRYRNRKLNSFNLTVCELLEEEQKPEERSAKIRSLKRMGWTVKKILEQSMLNLTDTFSGEISEKLGDLFDDLGFTDTELKMTRSVWFFRRARAARRLGQMKRHKTVPALTDLLKDPSTEVRMSAMEALSGMGAMESLEFAVESLANYSKIAAIRVAQLIQSSPKASVPVLLKMCGHGDAHVRLFAVQLLGLVQDPRSKATLINLYRTEETEIRIACLKALQVMKEETFFAAFLPRLNDPGLPWQERAQLAKMMGMAECISAVSSLKDCLSDPNWWVRKNAGESLSKLGEEGIQALVSSLESPDLFARDMALQWLDELGLMERARV